jgi:Domain of unknown function (DUF4440)
VPNDAALDLLCQWHYKLAGAALGLVCRSACCSRFALAPRRACKYGWGNSEAPLKHLIPFTAAMVALLLAGTAQAGDVGRASDNAVLEKIQALEEERNQAILRGDVATLDRMTSDDYTFVTIRGELRTKAQILNDFRSGSIKYQSRTISDTGVRQFCGCDRACDPTRHGKRKGLQRRLLVYPRICEPTWPMANGGPANNFDTAVTSSRRVSVDRAVCGSPIGIGAFGSDTFWASAQLETYPSSHSPQDV